MSCIFYTEPELVIALGKRVIFVNPDDLQIFKEIILPEDLTKCGLKVYNILQDAEQDETNKQQENLLKEQPTIQHVKMSPNHRLLVVTTSGQKALLLYELRPEHATLLSIRPLARASSALAFSSNSKRLLVTDKTGDCYEYDCEQYEAVPKLLLGHLSIVYDILWSGDDKFIITCDRDDKIRVTNYPATYDVHSYCLGHKEFVAGLQLLSDGVLISISGDKTMKLWNFKEGKEIKNVLLPAPGIKFVVKILDNAKYEIAVLLHQPNECVAIYVLTNTEDERWNFSTPQMQSFKDMICCNLCYAQDKLFVTGVQNEHLVIKLSAISTETSLNWLKMVEDQFKMYTWTAEDVSSWFKKKYDNVSEYMERKKRRIEEKLK